MEISIQPVLSPFLLNGFASRFLKDENDPKQRLQEVLAYCEQEYVSTTYLNKFKELKAISFIYTSNQMEKTIPKGTSEFECFKLLENIMKIKDPEEFKLSTWKADGSKDGTKPNESQMVQHILAYKYLCSSDNISEPLTVEKIKETHKILLKKAMDEDDNEIFGGIYRRVTVNDADHIYLDSSEIEVEMNRIVEAYNNSNEHFLLRAARLFYDVLTVHPFINGNGRLCRLLIAYSLMKDGVPFAVSLTTGQKQARKCYMDAIRRVRSFKDYSMLVQLILYSLFISRRNYDENSKFFEPIGNEKSQNPV